MKVTRIDILFDPPQGSFYECVFEDGSEVVVTITELLSRNKFHHATLEKLHRVYDPPTPAELGRLLHLGLGRLLTKEIHDWEALRLEIWPMEANEDTLGTIQ